MSEEKLTPEGLPDFCIGEAVKNLWDGKRLTRRGWNGRNMYLELQRPDENSKMIFPYIYLYEDSPG